jgi:hypothetical protein
MHELAKAYKLQKRKHCVKIYSFFEGLCQKMSLRRLGLAASMAEGLRYTNTSSDVKRYLHRKAARTGKVFG